MIEREAAQYIKRLAQMFPIVSVTGPPLIPENCNYLP